MTSNLTTLGKSARPIQRRRVPLSCDPCRKRKLKCNREKPCQNCTTRREQETCQYLAQKDGRAQASGGDIMRQRIDHLEDMVKKLIAERSDSSDIQNSHSTEPNDHAMPDQDKTAGGTTVVDANRSVHLNGNDWYDVLQEINNLKTDYRQTQDSPSDYSQSPDLSHLADGSSFFFSQARPVDKLEILSSLPPRSEIDRLLARIFDRESFPIDVPPIIHVPTFMREYNEHWKDPSKTSLIWLGLLFSLLGVTMLAFHQFGEPPEYEGISESHCQLYRIRTAQCLLSGDIAKCLPYTVETLRLNATAELNRKEDNSRGLWIMTGVIVRTAVNMGYHRDPARTAGISLLRAEYRRRVWLSVVTMDDMASFLCGLPPIMSTTLTDTMEPRNLHDWEIAEDMSALPSSRPPEEVTPTTYLIFKSRLCRVLGRIAACNSAPTSCSYDAVLELDKALQETYQAFPPQMRVAQEAMDRTLDIGSIDASALNLLPMYHKGQCLLHRRYMSQSVLSNQFRPSRDRCVNSALAILWFQQSLDSPAYTIAQARQILVLAAMILFLELELRRSNNEDDSTPTSHHLIEVLERCCALWADMAGTCGEARRGLQPLLDLLSTVRHRMAGEPGGQFTAPEMQGLAGLPDPFERVMSDMDFDWIAWDEFIHESGEEQ